MLCMGGDDVMCRMNVNTIIQDVTLHTWLLKRLGYDAVPTNVMHLKCDLDI